MFFSKTTASSRAKRARENERGGREKKIPHHYPLALAVYIYHPTELEEKIEGLWTGYASIRKNEEAL